MDTVGLNMEKAMATTPVFLPGESHGQQSLASYSPWVYKESDTPERLNTHTQTHRLKKDTSENWQREGSSEWI